MKNESGKLCYQVRKDMVSRNVQIVTAVLHGSTLAEEGKRFGITQERVRQMTNKLCRQTNRDLYYGGCGLKWLRDNKQGFILAFDKMMKESP